jgi:2-polyprenyl-3-methyl-5-hydroxy-6-metoxy-1,4-benzoquinol methylase
MRTNYRQSADDVLRWLGDALYEVKECTACGLCWQTFYPDEKLATALYDNWIDQTASRTGDLQRTSVLGYEPILQEVVALAGYVEKAQRVPLHDIKVLDYGMGWGSWLRIASAFGIQAYGYEVSPTRIAQAAELGITCLGDKELPAHKFHIINMEQVLEHVPDPGALVERLLPLLADGGLLKISVPNGKNTAALLRAEGARDLGAPNLVAIRPLEHVNSFTPQALRKLVGRLGLRVRRGPVLKQLSLICGATPYSVARSIGRPLVRGVLGLGTSLVLSR